MGINRDPRNSAAHCGAAVRRLCQLCNVYYSSLSQHVSNMHKTTITDLIIEGKWKNERFPED